MGRVEFRVRMEGSVSVLEVWGALDEAGALREAAALLLFRQRPWRALADRVTLRAEGRPGRQAVLRAYAKGRAAERS